MPDLTPFATVDELVAYWRVLTSTETTRASVLLTLASNRLRLYAENSDVDIDAKKTASEAYATTLQWVVMEAVKRALQAPADQPGLAMYSQTAGPYSENYKFSNPTGDLWFRKSELSALGISNQQSLSSITPKGINTEFYS